MSKITNNGLTRSGTWMLYSCTHMTTVVVKELSAKQIYNCIPALRNTTG